MVIYLALRELAAYRGDGLACGPLLLGKANLNFSTSSDATLVARGVSRILHHHAPPARPAAIKALTGIMMAFAALTVAACSSSSSQAPASQTENSAIVGTAVQQDCTAVGDVLSDGPDPGADAVGYAQAQVLPLRQLTIGNATLRRDVLALAAAYQAYSSGSGAGGKAAAAEVTKAEDTVNSICSQAAP
jgi:hypothetical protein